MSKPTNLFLKACAYACIIFAVTACKQTDDFFKEKDEGSQKEEANSFDFSTTRDVDLFVDYSDFETYGPVRFSIYATNPVVNENTDEEYVSENIKPIIDIYTDNRGKFDQTITLPAYAKELHVVTGNLAIGFAHSVVEVVNNEAKVIVKNDGSTTPAYIAKRAAGPGVSTNDMSNLKSTAYEVDSKGKPTSEKKYKEWVTPLGTWNSASGRPDYQLDKDNATPGLVLKDNEVEGMFNMVCNILPNGKDNSRYRNSADLMLKKESEVSVTVVGSFTCWNSTLGYYYYNDSNKPTDRMDLNVIMLFPNSQDGQRDLSWDYQGNIGTKRGDVIQLMYYPNIANGDLSGATKLFPAGTKIGFVMRSNAWGMMGDEYCSKKTATYFWNKKMNIWASSTDGLSWANPKINGSFSKPNPNGEARTAEFSHTTEDGTKYVILAFEDACDDYDFNDLIFALNPANVFTGLDELEKDKTTKHGIYAFEDMWPARGDYDMNDVVVDCEHQMEYSNGKVLKETFILTTYQNVVEKVSGLAMRLNTKVTPSKIVMKKAPKGGNAQTCSFTKDAKEGYYYLTDNVKSEINTSYIFEITYSTAQELNKTASIEPFLYGIRDGKNWEMHLPNMKPTGNMDTSFFGTENDASDPSKGKYFVRNSLYPFAFYLAGATAEDFLDTILATRNESKPIDLFYPEFLRWSTSNGTQNQDWYLHPKK